MFRLMYTKLNIFKVDIDTWRIVDRSQLKKPAEPETGAANLSRASTASTPGAAAQPPAAAEGGIDDVTLEDLTLEEWTDCEDDIDNGQRVWAEINDEFYNSDADPMEEAS